jgi:8-oxo-dGTP diphosphatase
MEEKDRSCTMLFVNPRGEVLLLLRDDKPDIPSPNMWDLPGGRLESGEGPRESLLREMGEELPGVELGQVRPFRMVKFPERIDYLFWTRIDVAEEELNRVLGEGQRVAWMSAEAIRGVNVAFGFREVLAAFLDRLERGLLD